LVRDIPEALSLSALTVIFPGEPGLAGFYEAKDDGSGTGDNWSYDSSQIVTTNKPTPSVLQAGCPSCHPTNSVRAL